MRISLQRFQGYLVLAPVLLALLVNFNVLANGFGWDDEMLTQTLRPSAHDWALVFSHPSEGFAAKQDSPYFRPLIELSYLLDRTLWGDRPFGFHLSVLLAHLFSTAGVYFLTRALVRRSTPSAVRNNAVPDFTALLAASLFAVHPVHVEAIAWIAGRNDVFCTAFMLSSLLLYVRFNRTGNWIVFGLSMWMFALALLTKETAVGLFVLFPLYDFLAASGNTDRPPTQDRPHALIPRGWRVAVRWITPLVIIGLYFFLRAAAISRPYGNASVSAVISPSAVSGALGALGLYLKLLVFPYPHNPFIATLPNSIPVLILSGLAGAGLLAGLIFALIRRQIVSAMGLAWTIATLLPAVSAFVLHVAVTPAAERYLYGPSVGYLIVISGWILNGLDPFPSAAGGTLRSRGIAAGLFIVMIITIGGWESWNRIAVWRDSMTFWQAASAASPEAGFPHRRLGLLSVGLKQFAQAEAHYRQAITLYEKTERPNLLSIGDTLNDQAALYHSLGRFGEAELLYQRSLAIREMSLGPDHPDVAISLYNLALLYYTQGRYVEAEPLYRRSLSIREKALAPGHPDVARSLHNLARNDYAQGRYAEAEAYYRQALSIYEKTSGSDPSSISNVLNDLAVLYRTQERYTEAEPLYQRSLSIREKTLGPDHPDLTKSLENYADLLRKMHRDPEAAALSARARAISQKRIQ
jgi:tetratricopeptide (TPR) repeat protein